MYHIKLLNKISANGLSHLNPACVVSEDAAANAIIVRSADMHEYEMNPELYAIARAGAGYNNIPVDQCAEAGICVFNTPGANANAVRELVICALLLSSRRIVEAIDWCKGLKGDPDALKKSGKGQESIRRARDCGENAWRYRSWQGRRTRGKRRRRPRHGGTGL